MMWDYFLPKQGTKWDLLVVTGVVGQVEHRASVHSVWILICYRQPDIVWCKESSVLLWKKADEGVLITCCPAWPSC